MNQSVHTRTFDIGVPDLPPPAFDESVFAAYRNEEPAKVKNVIQQKLVRVPIKIARAIAGTTEIRLLRQTEEGAEPASKPLFILEKSVLQPYHAVRTELHRKRKDVQVPMNEAEAAKAFDAAVLSQYPAEVLRSGISVAIHQILL